MTAKPQTHADSQRVLAALMGLHHAYPLERRMQKEACDATRETYLAVLLRWVHTGTAPSVDGFDHESLDELAALDAAHIVNGKISCPPFSVAATDMAVHTPHGTLHAFSAIDALAMPRLLNAAATIETRCALSGESISFTVTEKGELRLEDINRAVVAFQKVSNHIARYTLDLAPGIRFVLPQHAAALRQTLSLAESAAVAHAFYAFQRKLLKGDAL
ncbi:MAG: hypothetical protein IV108_06660 [Burkholderiales bacterium]|nr:hypothetical protein [Burkholderiales bacterium]